MSFKLLKQDTIITNKSKNKIWVDRVSGFKSNPPVGILGSNSMAMSIMGRMKAPDEVTIHWSRDLHKADQTSIVRIDWAVKPSGNDKLIFTFTDKELWKVHSEKQ